MPVTRSLEARIAGLYQLSLDAFTAARNELARELGGDAGKAVRQRPKPSTTAWVINQFYWQARGEFEALRLAGARLLAAQMAALDGRPSDLREANQQHRNTVAAATARAVAVAGQEGVSASRDQVAQALEAVSLTRDLAEPAGHMTTTPAPAGFAAFGGQTFGLSIAPAPGSVPRGTAAAPLAANRAKNSGAGRAKGDAALAARIREEQRAEAVRAREREKAEARWRTQLQAAEAVVAEAETALERAEAALADAEARRANADAACTSARIALADARVAVRTIRESRAPRS